MKESKMREGKKDVKIILVDDVFYALASTKERLKAHYEIYPAQSVEILFEMLQNFLPDLILLDVNMPDVDGFEVLKRLKNDKQYAGIPVIFLTSNHDKKSIITGMQLGAVDFIKKPFSNEELISCIDFQLSSDEKRGAKPVVLAVDDSPSILGALNFLLGNLYTVYTLPNPENIHELLKIVTPDLFILDGNMPEISGYELVPIIRAIPNHEYTPIIFLTSDATADNLYVAKQLGASDFIVKPIEEAVLYEKIAAHLSDFVIRRRLRIKSRRESR